MKINKALSNKSLDVWECKCGTHTPVKKGSPKPECEYCRRVKEPVLKKKLLWQGTQGDVNKVAEWLHDRYERYAIVNEWETQNKCQVKFDDLPEENKETMRDLARDVLVWRQKALNQKLAEVGKVIDKVISKDKLTGKSNYKNYNLNRYSAKDFNIGLKGLREELKKELGI